MASDAPTVLLHEGTNHLPSKNKPTVTRDRRYKDRRRAEGLVQVLVWVPAKAAPTIRHIAQHMRKRLKEGAPEYSDEASPPSGNTGGITPLEKYLEDKEKE